MALKVKSEDDASNHASSLEDEGVSPGTVCGSTNDLPTAANLATSNPIPTPSLRTNKEKLERNKEEGMESVEVLAPKPDYREDKVSCSVILQCSVVGREEGLGYLFWRQIFLPNKDQDCVVTWWRLVTSTLVAPDSFCKPRPRLTSFHCPPTPLGPRSHS